LFAKTNLLNQKERPPMKKYTRKLGKVIQIDENQIQEHLGELVRGTEEETLNEGIIHWHASGMNNRYASD
jgi:hypothetical protein